MVPKLLSLAVVQKVLQSLLRERVSIRDAASILEALGEVAPITKSTVLPTEYVRQEIRRQLVKPLLDGAGDLTAHFLDPAVEQVIESLVEHAENSSDLNLSPQSIRYIQERAKTCCGQSEMPVVLLTSSGSRFFGRQMTESIIADLTCYLTMKYLPETKLYPWVPLVSAVN